MRKVIDYIREGWIKYSLNGVPNKELSPGSERIIYTNYIVAVAIATSVIHLFKFLYYQQHEALLCTFGLILLCIPLPFLVYRQRYFTSKILLGFSLNIMVILISLFDDKGDLYLYFAVVVIPFVLFEKKHIFWIYFFAFQTLLFWFLYDYFVQGYDSLDHSYRYFGIYVTFIIIIITVQTFVNLTHKNQLELIRTKKIAEEANEYKTQFLSKFSHEIKTPLNASLGFSNIMLENKILDDESLDYIKSIKYSNSLLNHIISDILTLSTMENGELNVLNEPFEIRKVIKELKRNLEFTYPQSDIDFNVSIEDNIPPIVFGDQFRLYQILQNLCSNALKFTSKGLVSLEVKNVHSSIEKGTYQFIIKDTGHGILPSEIHNVFEPFVRLERDSDKTGVGLGLAITKSLVELLKGKISVLSSEGKGTEFVVGLDFNYTKANIHTEEGHVIPSFSGLNLLILDDNQMSKDLLVHLLSRTGVNIHLASSTNEAKNILSERDFDLIIIEIVSKKSPEFDFVKSLMHSEEYSNLPIIGTSTNTKVLQKHLIEQSSISLLSKPIHKQELVDLINKKMQYKASVTSLVNF